MEAWWQCEIPYPFVPQDVLDAADSVRGEPAQPLLRPAHRRRSVRGGDRRVPAVRRPRHERARHRASRRHQLADRLQPDAGRHPGAPDAKGAHPEPRHAGFAAPRPGADRGGVRHRRRHLARPVGDRLRQIGRQRDGVGQCQPGQQRRALLGGDRPDPEGARRTRTGRSAGRASISPIATSTSGRARGSSRIRACGRRRAIRRRPPRSGGAAWCMCWCCAGPRARKRAYAAHRRARAEAGLPPVTTDNFAYAALVYVGDTEEEGIAGRQQAAVVPQHQPEIGAAIRQIPARHGAAAIRAANLPHAAQGRRENGLANAEKGVAPASQNAARLISMTPEQAMARGHPVRRQSRQRLSRRSWSSTTRSAASGISR